MTYMPVRNKVRDFDVWKSVFVLEGKIHYVEDAG